jgi:hypothetical protein
MIRRFSESDRHAEAIVAHMLLPNLGKLPGLRDQIFSCPVHSVLPSVYRLRRLDRPLDALVNRALDRLWRCALEDHRVLDRGKRHLERLAEVGLTADGVAMERDERGTGGALGFGRVGHGVAVPRLTFAAVPVSRSS